VSLPLCAIACFPVPLVHHSFHLSSHVDDPQQFSHTRIASEIANPNDCRAANPSSWINSNCNTNV